MPRFRVVVADFIADELRPERDTLGDIADLEMLNAHSEADLGGRVENADAIMLYHNIAITRATIGRLERCKLIVRCGVGYDNVDHRFARERGIPVANVPDYGTEEVADSAIGLTLALTRGIAFLNSRLQRGEGGWAYRQVAPSSGWGGSAARPPSGHRRWGWTWHSSTRTSRMGTTRYSAFGALRSSRTF